MTAGETDAAELQTRLCHVFRDPHLLIQAITHAGAAQGRPGAPDNERLEFLGDRVLGLVIADLLIERFPDAPEGELGPRLTALVRRETLADVARSIGLGDHLVLARADAAAGARDNPKLLADACEAVIAALYRDGGLEAARRFVMAGWGPRIHSLAATPVDPKSALQEWAQGRGKPLPAYASVQTGGTPHSPVFEATVTVDGLPGETAAGSSKRAAEKAAALALLRRLGVAVGEGL